MDVSLPDATIKAAINDHLHQQINNGKLRPDVPPGMRHSSGSHAGVNLQQGRCKVTGLRRRGVDNLMRATLLRLSEQMRSEDEEHNAVLQQMQKGVPPSVNQLAVYQTLSVDDMDDSRWRYAPILVSTNRERYDLIHEQTIRFAREHGIPVIRWQRKWRNWQGQPKLYYNEVHDSDPIFWELFVPGASGFLTYNLCTSIGLVNGCPIRYHSLTMHDQEEQAMLDELVTDARPGQIITLDREPKSVNVEVYPDLSDDVKEKRANQTRRNNWPTKLGNLSSRPDIVIIPLVRSSRLDYHESTVVRRTTACHKNGRAWCLPSRVQVKDTFPCEPAFSIVSWSVPSCSMSYLLIFCHLTPFICHVSDCSQSTGKDSH